MDGILIIDKPAGMTSHDVVSRVRRAVGTRRVGHAGTLDPFATGVLVVCINRATRLSAFLTHLDKEYLATVRLGFATDTQDVTGKQITPLKTSNRLSLEELYHVLAGFTGPQLQTPPMFSAKQVAGERLYRAARAGREVERQPVPIIVHAIELTEKALKKNEDGTLDFIAKVRCSSGTYVRTLAHDIGAKLNVGGHLAALRRTAVGHFEIASAVNLEELEHRGREGTLSNLLVSPADALRHLAAVKLDADGANRVANGREIFPTRQQLESIQGAAQPLRLLHESGELLAVGQYDPDRRVVKPTVVLHTVNPEG